MEQATLELIRRRRAQMLVHSYIYYVMNDNLISDHRWQTWADELVQLQEKHTGPIGFYDEAFKEWNASTGFHLPKDGWVISKSLQLLRHRDSNQTPLLQGDP